MSSFIDGLAMELARARERSLLRRLANSHLVLFVAEDVAAQLHDDVEDASFPYGWPNIVVEDSLDEGGVIVVELTEGSSSCIRPWKVHEMMGEREEVTDGMGGVAGWRWRT